MVWRDSKMFGEVWGEGGGVAGEPGREIKSSIEAGRLEKGIF